MILQFLSYLFSGMSDQLRRLAGFFVNDNLDNRPVLQPEDIIFDAVLQRHQAQQNVEQPVDEMEVEEIPVQPIARRARARSANADRRQEHEQPRGQFVDERRGRGRQRNNFGLANNPHLAFARDNQQGAFIADIENVALAAARFEQDAAFAELNRDLENHDQDFIEEHNRFQQLLAANAAQDIEQPRRDPNVIAGGDDRHHFRILQQLWEDHNREDPNIMENMGRRMIVHEVPSPTMVCEMCRVSVRCPDMYDHIPGCAEAKTAPKTLQRMMTHKFLGDKWVSYSSLKKMTVELVLHYYQACYDRTYLSTLVCTTCKSYQHHMEGGCLAKEVKEVFERLANSIAEQTMAHFEQYLECKKQVGLEKIQENHGDNFTRIQDWFNDTPTDPDTEANRIHVWYEFRMNTCEAQSAEKKKYLEGLDARNRGKYQQHKQSVARQVRAVASHLERIISAGKRNRYHLAIQETIADALTVNFGFEHHDRWLDIRQARLLQHLWP